MPFATSELSFGPYSLTWNGLALGLLEGPARFNMIFDSEMIQADQYGSSTIDGIYRGGDMFAHFVLKEWKAATKAAMNPFATLQGDSGAIGRSLVDMSKPLIFTAMPNTPAFVKGPKIRNCPLAILSPKHNVDVIMGTAARDVPIIMQIFPSVYGNANELRWFTDT